MGRAGGGSAAHRQGRAGPRRRGAGQGTGRVGAGVRGVGVPGERARRRVASAAIRPCWPVTRPRGQLRHGHNCCDTAPVPAVSAAMCAPRRACARWLGQIGTLCT